MENIDANIDLPDDEGRQREKSCWRCLPQFVRDRCGSQSRQKEAGKFLLV